MTCFILSNCTNENYKDIRISKPRCSSTCDKQRRTEIEEGIATTEKYEVDYII
jgi:hypothetical protein